MSTSKICLSRPVNRVAALLVGAAAVAALGVGAGHSPSHAAGTPSRVRADGVSVTVVVPPIVVPIPALPTDDGVAGWD